MNFRSIAIVAFLIACSWAFNNGLGKTPPLGWSTWCTDGLCSRDYCSDAEIMSVAETMVQNGMQALGYNYIVLDDCWAADYRAPDGTLTWSTTRFPRGMPDFISRVHAKGFKLGLYTSAGNVTCDHGGRPHPIPGSEHHYQLDVNTFASWKVDYVKLDWCGDVHNMPLDGIAVGAKDYIDFSKALLNATPARPMYYEGVGAFIFLLDNVGTYINSWRASTDHHDNWNNTMGVLDTVNLVGVAGKPGAWSYMDVLMTGGQGCKNAPAGTHPHCPGMTDIEYFSEFALWSIFQSPLVVSTDVRNMTDAMTRILLKSPRIIEAHQDTRTMPGKLHGGDTSCSEWGAETCNYYIRKMYDGSALVVLFNYGELEHTIKFDFSAALGWPAGSAAIVEDMWGLLPNTTLVGGMNFTVPSHGQAYKWVHPK